MHATRKRMAKIRLIIPYGVSMAFNIISPSPSETHAQATMSLS